MLVIRLSRDLEMPSLVSLVMFCFKKRFLQTALTLSEATYESWSGVKCKSWLSERRDCENSSPNYFFDRSTI